MIEFGFPRCIFINSYVGNRVVHELVANCDHDMLNVFLKFKSMLQPCMSSQSEMIHDSFVTRGPKL